MKYSFRSPKQRDDIYSRILFIGLFLSQTQFIINVSHFNINYQIPYFTLFYFILSTSFLAFLMIRYTFFYDKHYGFLLDFYEAIVIPISSLLLILLLTNNGFDAFKIVCIILLSIKGTLLCIKIIYLQSVTPQFAQITYFGKIFRIIKLYVMALSPLLLKTLIIELIIISSLQAISCLIVLMKFTYQKCKNEYILLASTAAGIMSISQYIIDYIFGRSYFFIGQIMLLYFYLIEDQGLRYILQLKYMSNLKNKNNKMHEHLLIDFNFLTQCILKKRSSIHISSLTRNKSLSILNQMMDRLTIDLQFRNIIKNQNNFSQFIELGQRQKEVILFDLFQYYFKKTGSFSCLQFIINSCLALKGVYIFRALFIYYNNIQNKKEANQIYTQCIYGNLYKKIISFIPKKKDQKQKILYFDFHDKLENLKQLISTSINNEIKLVQYFGDEDKNKQRFPDDLLVDRHKIKAKINQEIKKCFQQAVYAFSTDFIFLFILFSTAIEKNISKTKKLLKKHFLGHKINEGIYNSYETSLIVVSGMNIGEIINSNKRFKNEFGKTMNSFNKKNIQQFFPSQKQRKKHLELMKQAGSRRIEPKDHANYDCLLLILNQSLEMTIKVLQKFSISVKLCYEYDYGLYYICGFKKMKQNSQNYIMKNYVHHEQKNLSVVLSEPVKIEQLGQTFELCSVICQRSTYNFESSQTEGINQSVYGKQNVRAKIQMSQNISNLLQEKIGIIQKKLNQKQFKQDQITNGLYWLIIIMMAALIVYLIVVFKSINQKISNFQYVILSQHNQIIKAEMSLYQFSIIRLIANFNMQTPYFPSNICSGYGVDNITQYISEHQKSFSNQYLYDLEKYKFANQFEGLADKDFYQKIAGFSSINPNNTFSFQKRIQLQRSRQSQQFNIVLNGDNNYNILAAFTRSPVFIQKHTTFKSSDKLSYLLKDLIQQLKQNNSLFIGIISFITPFIIVAVIIVILILQLKGTQQLILLLKTTQDFDIDFLSRKNKQLNYSSNLINKIDGNDLQNMEINHNYVLSIKQNDKPNQNIPLQQFHRWQINNNLDPLQDIQDDQKDEQDQLLQIHEGIDYQSDQNDALSNSAPVRILFYNKVYCLLILIFLIITISLGFITFQIIKTELSSVSNFKYIQQSFRIVEAEYHKMVAYNWFKVMSIYIKDANMTLVNQMHSQSISALIKHDFIQVFQRLYAGQIKNGILYGDVCKFFNNISFCDSYRNGIFKYGLTNLLPLTIKQQAEIKDMSSNSTESFMFNLCDKTILLLDGVKPMSQKIPIFGYNKSMQAIKTNKIMYLSIIFSTIAIMLVIMIAYLRNISKKTKIIYEEILSMDFVWHLYKIKCLQPYLNRIYYS